MSGTLAYPEALPRRKGPQIAANKRETHPRIPCRRVCDLVWDAAKRLALAGDDAREISLVLAGRFHLSERQVDRILVLHGMSHERRATGYAVGHRNTAAMAEEAGAAVWREVA